MHVVDESLDLVGGDLALESRDRPGRGVGAFGHRAHELRRGCQVQAEGRGHVGEDALGRADGNAGVAPLDVRDLVQVRLEGGRQLGALLVEVARVRARDGLERGGDPVRDLRHVGGVVPEVRVVALLLAHDVSDVENLAVAGFVRIEQLLAPVVVARAIQDDQSGFGECASVAGAALVLVRVGVGIGDHALHADLRAAELRHEIAPEVLARHDVDGRRRAGGRTSAGGQQQPGRRHAHPPSHGARALHKLIAQVKCA